MTHFRTLYIGHDSEEDFAPYGEQDGRYFRPVDRTKDLRADYKKYGKEYRKNGKAKNIVKFAQIWYGIDTVVDKASLAPALFASLVNKLNALHKRHIIANGTRLVKVTDYYNPDAKYDYYSKEENITADFKPEEMLEKARENRRNFYRKVVGILGHQPQFTSFEEVMEQVEEEQGGRKEDYFDKVGDRYWEQPDLKVLDDNGIRVDADIRCSEEEYVAKASLPFCAIVTDKGWFEEARTGMWGTTIGPVMDGKDWAELQMLVIKDALQNPRNKVWLCDCHI